jgi:parallel beta-helix repeat protein
MLISVYAGILQVDDFPNNAVEEKETTDIPNNELKKEISEIEEIPVSLEDTPSENHERATDFESDMPLNEYDVIREAFSEEIEEPSNVNSEIKNIPDPHGTRAPSIDAGGPYGTQAAPFYEGDTINFQATFSDPDPRSTYSFRWDVQDDGKFETGWMSSLSYTHLSDDNFNTARVQAWDGTSFIIIENGTGIWDDDNVEVGLYNYLGSRTFGILFTVNEDVTVTELGGFKFTSWYSGAIWPDYYGNFRLYTTSGTMLAQTGPVTPATDDWGWASIPDTDLYAGNDYIFSTWVRTPINYPNYYCPGDYLPGPSADGVINPTETRYWNGNGFPMNTYSYSYLPKIDLKYRYDRLIPNTIEDIADAWVENISPNVYGATSTPNPQYAGVAVDLTASFDDPGFGDDWEYRWDFGDGTNSGWLPLQPRNIGGSAKILLLHTWGSESKWIMEGLEEVLGDFIEVIDRYNFGPLGEGEAPELSYLQEYDVVMVSMNYYVYDPDISNGLGNVLANYSDSGGGVVQMAFAAGIESKSQVAGRWMAQAYNPLGYSLNHYGYVNMGTVYDPDHMIMCGISDLAAYYKHNALYITPGATLLADYQNNIKLCAYTNENHKAYGGGRIVGLNLLPWPAYLEDDGMLMTANAIMWASQKAYFKTTGFTLDPVQHAYIGPNPMKTQKFVATVEVRDDDHGKFIPTSRMHTIIPTERFETSFPPIGWTVVNHNPPHEIWRRNDYWGRPNYAGGEGYCANADPDAAYPWYQMDTSLITPSMDLGSFQSATLDYITSYNYIGGSEYADVDVSIDGGITWTNVLHWSEDHSPTGPGEEVSIDLGLFTGNSDVRVRFHHNSGGGWGWWWEVDNVNITASEGFIVEGIDFASTNVIIKPHDPPVPNAGGPYYSGFEGTSIAFDASATIDPEDTPLTFRWDFENDGLWDTAWLESPLFDYTYPDDYEGFVRVEVTDGLHIVNATAEVTVFNVPPQTGFSFTPEAPEVFKPLGIYAEVTFTAYISDPGSDSHTITWDFGDGTIITGNELEIHIYYEKGSYNVTLDVIDDDGGTDTATTIVLVTGDYITVNSSGGGDFSNIQDAIDAAEPLALIFVEDGTYKENVVIDKPLRLFGVGFERTIIDGGGNKYGITIASSDVSISGFTICNNSKLGVKIENGSVNVFENRISENDCGVVVINGSGIVNINDNWILNHDLEGILVDNWTSSLGTVYIQYNRIENNGQYGIHIENMSNTTNRVIIQKNRNVETNKVTGTPNGIYGQVISLFIHNSDNVSILYNTIEEYYEFGILDLGNENDTNYFNKIQYNKIDGLNRSGTVGMVSQYVYTNLIRQNTFIHNGWWGAKSLFPSYIYWCINWNRWIQNGFYLPPGGEFPSNWPDPEQGDTSRGGGYYFDPPPGSEIPEFHFDGNVMIGNAIGIMVEGATNKLILSNNTIKGSEIAIYVESGDPVIENNRLTHNIKGITIVLGSPVINGNIIDHNEVGITINALSEPQIGENVLVHNDDDIINLGPKSIISSTVTLLENAKTGDEKIDNQIDKAIEHLQRSINIDPNNPEKAWKHYPLWRNEIHLDPKQGHKVFNEIKKAINILMKLIEDKDIPQELKDTLREVIDNLIKMVEIIAKSIYEYALEYAGSEKVDLELEKSENEFVKSEIMVKMNHYGKAIDCYKKAWEHSLQAVKHART